MAPPIPKPLPRAVERRDRRRAKDTALRSAWSIVDTRDRFKCRCCGVTLGSMQRHRHHIQYRSQGGNDVPSNLVLLCAACHGLIHTKRLFIHGDDANKSLSFRRED